MAIKGCGHNIPLILSKRICKFQLSKFYFEIKGAVYTRYLGMCVVDKTELMY